MASDKKKTSKEMQNAQNYSKSRRPLKTRIMRGNVFERRIILPVGSRSGGPILFLKISRKRRAFQGGAAPALNHLARRSHQRLTSGHRC